MKASKPKAAVPVPVTRKKRKPRTAKKSVSIPDHQAVSEVRPVPELPRLSSQNIAKILSGFLTIRSTVKELSRSLQKAESLMDSAWFILHSATQMRKGFQIPNFLPLLPPAGNRREGPRTDGDEDIPVIHPPEGMDGPESNIPFPPFMNNIPLGQILAVLQSPLVWRWLSELFKARNRNVGLKRKQG